MKNYTCFRQINHISNHTQWKLIYLIPWNILDNFLLLLQLYLPQTFSKTCSSTSESEVCEIPVQIESCCFYMLTTKYYHTKPLGCFSLSPLKAFWFFLFYNVYPLFCRWRAICIHYATVFKNADFLKVCIICTGNWLIVISMVLYVGKVWIDPHILLTSM